MNRLLEGHGVKGSQDVFISRGQALKETGYAPLLAFLDTAAQPAHGPQAGAESVQSLR